MKIQLVLLLVTCSAVANAFLSPVQQPLARRIRHPNVNIKQKRDVAVFLFRDMFNKLKRDKSNDDESNASNTVSDSSDTTTERTVDSTAFFASDTNDTYTAPTATATTAAAEEETPEAKALKLRAQAARIRLEAEKGQVELTLEKISKLDDKLNKIKSKKEDGTSNNSDKQQQELEEALSVLKSQLVTDENGEISFVPAPIKPVMVSKNSTKSSREEIKSASSVPWEEKLNTEERNPAPVFTNEELQEITMKFNDAPEFLRVMLAKIAGVTNEDKVDLDKLNATEIITTFYQDEQQVEQQTEYIRVNTSDARALIERAYEQSGDKNYVPMPLQRDIDNKVEELQNLPGWMKKFVTGKTNDTDIALDLLMDERERRVREKKKGKSLFNGFGADEDETIGRDGESINENGGTFRRLFGEDESAEGSRPMTDDISLLIESTFPASTRKEGDAPSDRDVNAFHDVLGSTRAFLPEGDPVPVPGGWIIRGKNECKNGDELIEKLDRRIANVASLRDNISFFLIKDPFPPSQEDFIQDPLNWPQVLFVAGSDVARDPRPVIGTIISAIGISTAWYASIYPFLTNTKIFDRAEEAMNLADAGMPVDLSWLSDQSIPLFFSFMGLQILHETAHLSVAKAKNFEVTVPTFIPSVISGITGSITSLKTSPKNKSDLLLFGVSGPLTSMIGSLLLEVYGLALTASADAQSLQSFPGLPLALLRQSSLGGGIVDLVLGNGILNVPSSIEGTNMLASTIIPLHPFAIAGFVSLLVNALALVPVGRTDGGRIALSMFGRSASQGLTLFSLTALFVLGFSGSDLMLFYFGFCVFAQLELEIPLRNEIDDADLLGVTSAVVSWIIMALVLIPLG
eukprot:scaffold92765_cov67-Cyclotella_meneghiniana.AAC.5